MNRLIALCDCNNFFVSCERIERPDLDDRPVAVLSANDGCIISRSQEVKALGVPMGAPYYQYRSLLEKNGATIFSSDFRFYRKVSDKVMAVLARYTDDLEKYSVDEAFFNISIASIPDAAAYAREIKEALYKETRVPASFGIARTKTLAKLAGETAKKIKELDGIYSLENCPSIENFLRGIPVSEVWGVGRRSGEFLKRNKIATAWDYAQLDDLVLKTQRGIRGLMTAWELRGTACIHYEYPAAKKSIQVSRSFGNPLYTYDELKIPVAQFVAGAAANLRHQGSRAGALTVMIRTGYYDEIPYANARTVLFGEPLSRDGELIFEAHKVLKDIYKEGPRYQKAGIILSSFSSGINYQKRIFEELDLENDKEKRLSRAIDEINSAGLSVRPATSYFTDERSLSWKPKQQWKAERKHTGSDALEDLQNHAFSGR